MTSKLPDWFVICEEANHEVMLRIAASTEASAMAVQIKSAPMLAHWFLLDSLLLANQANRDGMHANALSLTRQCLEAVSIIELGLCGHKDAEDTLLKWNKDELTPGKLRAWLEQNVWPKYGAGLWSEPWSVFMREFAAALQPYAHYGTKLSQWQTRLVTGAQPTADPSQPMLAILEVKPRAYDAQKATRITLFHAILSYALGRIWLASNTNDAAFSELIRRLGVALGKSRYLDGHATNWSQQFWAMMWGIEGDTILE